MTKWRACALAAVFIAASCGAKPSTVATQPADTNAVPVDSDEAEMKAATQQAQDSLEEFRMALQTPRPGQSSFLVKARFVDGEHVEVMWLNQVTYTDGHYSGIVNNEPVHATNVKIGDRARIPEQEVVVWMFFDQDRHVAGAYTLHVLRSRMPAEERAVFDSQVPLRLKK